jgi:GDP-L-fucose synthase
MSILITGSNGYIGKSLYNSLRLHHKVLTISRQEVDLTNSESVRNYFKDKYFDTIIHCAVSGGNRTKHDTSEVIDNNLKMYYNLLDNKKHFNKFIHFGSGAEIHFKDTPYGLSKHVIRESILGQDNFYNLRIFAVFDENELETRFIKTSIKKYLENQSIEIFKDKRMDFLYMPDLITLVNYYLNNNDLPKEIDCKYNYTPTLLDIAEIINGLDNYRVPIKFNSTINDKAYIGKFHNLGLNFIGLEQGIINTYNKIKNEY